MPDPLLSPQHAVNRTGRDFLQLPGHRLAATHFPQSLPNANPAGNPQGYNYVLPYTTDQNGWMAHTRVDYNFTDNTKLFVSYNAQRETDNVPVHLWWIPQNSVPFPGGLSSKDNSNTVSRHLLHIFSPTLTNELVATFSYLNLPLAPNNPSLV
jgi:hypothetical protein